ncbi:MAG: CdaR family protein [Erysipelotrichaceae bacterium]
MSKKREQRTKTEIAKKIAQEGQRFTQTYEAIGTRIIRMFRWVSMWFDKILFNQKYGKLVALALAVVLFLSINTGGEASFTTLGSADIIKDVPVSVLVNDSVYEVKGIPQTVNVTVIGELADIQLVRSQSDYKIVADLSGLTEGIHEVELTAVDFSPRVNVIVQPSKTTVTISKKMGQSFRVGYDFVNMDKMNMIYALGTPEFEQGEVLVRASESTINSIAFVKALIDVSNVTGDFEQEATLVAYDQSGNKVDVDILPSKVKVKVGVSEPKKDVPITIEPIGLIPDGKAIAGFKLDHDTVTLYGPDAVLEKINEVKIQVPAQNLTKNTQLTMPLILPSGVAKTSVTKVNIKIELADAVEKTIDNIPITYINNTNGYSFKPVNPEDVYANVVLSGAQSQIDAIKPEDLQVYIDFAQISEPGQQDVILTVVGTNKLVSYSLAKPTITLIVEEK